MVENIFQSKWFTQQVGKEASREALSIGDRVGEMIAIVCTVIVIAFFAIHQTRPTGFFTDDTAPTLVYLVLVVGVIPPVLRFVTGRRNFARLFEALGMAVFLVVGLYLLITFPFDMDRFAQPLWRWLEFVLDWIPEWLAKAFLVIGVVASVFFSPYTYMLHVSVKEKLAGQKQEKTRQEEPA